MLFEGLDFSMKKLLLLMAGVVLWTTPVRADEVEDNRNYFCLALNIYHEARGEDDLGKIAVAFVTMNRVLSDKFPDNICDVVWQANQFSWTNDGKSDYPNMQNTIETKAWQRALFLAEAFVFNWDNTSQYDITKGSTFYHSKKVKPYWASHFTRVVEIGYHIFYKE